MKRINVSPEVLLSESLMLSVSRRNNTCLAKAVDITQSGIEPWIYHALTRPSVEWTSYPEKGSCLYLLSHVRRYVPIMICFRQRFTQFW